ncbi:MAG: SMC-Scp complex subunit ScpB [Tepidisphaeraceae bacterium]
MGHTPETVEQDVQTPHADATALPAEPAPPAQTPLVAEPPDGPVETGFADEEAPAAGDSAPATEQAAVNPGVLEALLFSTHSPLTPQRLAELMELKSQKTLKKAIKELNRQYEETGRCFRVEQVAGGYQLLTLPEYGEWLIRLLKRESDSKLTRAAIETLSIIAYKQPILRAEIEAIRGVACGETVRSLMEKHLVRIAGRAEEPGRPILYGTTRRFLELFGLNSLKDLPGSDELQLPRPAAATAPEIALAPEPAAAPSLETTGDTQLGNGG